MYLKMLSNKTKKHSPKFISFGKNEDKWELLLFVKEKIHSQESFFLLSKNKYFNSMRSQVYHFIHHINNWKRAIVWLFIIISYLMYYRSNVDEVIRMVLNISK